MVCIDPSMCECVSDDSSVVCVYVGWVRSVGVGVYVCGGGLEGYVFCCDNLYCAFLF